MLAHELPDVLRDDALLITLKRSRRIAEPAQVGGDHAVALRQRRDDFAPAIPALRPSMQQDDGIASPGAHVMDDDVAGVEIVMCDLHVRSVSILDQCSGASAKNASS